MFLVADIWCHWTLVIVSEGHIWLHLERFRDRGDGEHSSPDQSFNKTEELVRHHKHISSLTLSDLQASLGTGSVGGAESCTAYPQIVDISARTNMESQISIYYKK